MADDQLGSQWADRRPRDSITLLRFLLEAASAGGADPHRLVRDSGLPAWTLAMDQAMIAPRHLLRLWELVEHAVGDPYFALCVAGHHKASTGHQRTEAVAAGRDPFGRLDLFEYLLTTATTLGDGLLASIRFLPLLTTNRLLRIEAETEAETTYSFRLLDGADTRGAELALQTWVATWCARVRTVTGHQVTPVHVGFAHRAPRPYRAFATMLGTDRMDFDMPATTLTFRNRDLDHPQQRADPVLSGILRSHASTLSPPPSITWSERIQRLLDQTLGQGTASLDAIAQRLAVSPRTLQRQLAGHGTTWRAELDKARQRHAQLAAQDANLSLAELAHRMGYENARSARRALGRWNNLEGE